VNTHAPPFPKRSAPGREIAGAVKLRLADHYRSPISAQAISDETLRRWFAEAERIASEHHRSQNVRHLRAFCRMIGGIMEKVEKALPQ
jgi:hypothetical protein